MSAHRNKNSRPSLYGFHAVSEAWLNPERDIEALHITKQAESGFHGILAQAAKKGLHRPAPSITDKNQLERLLPKGAVHQGIALTAKPLEDHFIQDFIIKSKTQDRTILLMLDQVSDPHNVGAIIRSACVFGADGIIMQRKTAPEISGVLAKTACGGVEHLPIALETNLSRAIETLKEEGFFVYGLDERGRRNVGDISSGPNAQNEKILFILGAEGPGMRRLIKENCDELVKLPTDGPISSLNVSNAAAVALYAISS